MTLLLGMTIDQYPFPLSAFNGNCCLLLFISSFLLARINWYLHERVKFTQLSKALNLRVSNFWVDSRQASIQTQSRGWNDSWNPIATAIRLGSDKFDFKCEQCTYCAKLRESESVQVIGQKKQQLCQMSTQSPSKQFLITNHLDSVLASSVQLSNSYFNPQLHTVHVISFYFFLSPHILNSE